MAKNKDSHYNQMIEKQDKKCYYRVTKSQKSKANEQSSLKRFFSTELHWRKNTSRTSLRTRKVGALQALILLKFKLDSGIHLNQLPFQNDDGNYESP